MKRINFQGQESERTQALREAELLSKVRHEHILNYIESFEDDECLNIVTEYCDGGDLEVYLRNRNGKSLPEVRVCHWIYQTASGLQVLLGMCQMGDICVLINVHIVTCTYTCTIIWCIIWNVSLYARRKNLKSFTHMY